MENCIFPFRQFCLGPTVFFDFFWGLVPAEICPGFIICNLIENYTNLLYCALRRCGASSMVRGRRKTVTFISIWTGEFHCLIALFHFLRSRLRSVGLEFVGPSAVCIMIMHHFHIIFFAYRESPLIWLILDGTHFMSNEKLLKRHSACKSMKHTN